MWLNFCNQRPYLSKAQNRKEPVDHCASKAFSSRYLRSLGRVTWVDKASTIGALSLATRAVMMNVVLGPSFWGFFPEFCF